MKYRAITTLAALLCVWATNASSQTAGGVTPTLPPPQSITIFGGVAPSGPSFQDRPLPPPLSAADQWAIENRIRAADGLPPLTTDDLNPRGGPPPAQKAGEARKTAKGLGK